MKESKGNAPGKSYRNGISLIDLFKKFPDDKAAENWFISNRWKDGEVICPHCHSGNVLVGAKHKTMPFRCREKDCRKRFSVRTGTVMECSRLGYQIWAIAIFQMTTNIKGISSMKLHRDLDITQKSAWYLAHRLRDTWCADQDRFTGVVEVDETFVGGLEKNKHKDKKLNAGRGGTGKAIVVGMKERDTKKVKAKVIENTKRNTLHSFVNENVKEGSTVNTDDFKSYRNLANHKHKYVRHSIGEYVNEQAHINGIESFWSMLKRAHKGTYHKMSKKHLHRYIAEFEGRHNVREQDTIDQMSDIVSGMEGKRLKYDDLVSGVDGRLH